eukprot:6206084-Pleurochrysis_carterae.AAC.1
MEVFEPAELVYCSVTSECVRKSWHAKSSATTNFAALLPAHNLSAHDQACVCATRPALVTILQRSVMDFVSRALTRRPSCNSQGMYEAARVHTAVCPFARALERARNKEIDFVYCCARARTLMRKLGRDFLRVKAILGKEGSEEEGSNWRRDREGNQRGSRGRQQVEEGIEKRATKGGPEEGRER